MNNILGEARAAIEAMREPTEAMWRGGVRVELVGAVDWVAALAGTGISSYEQILEQSYHGMIDASLHEGEAER